MKSIRVLSFVLSLSGVTVATAQAPVGDGRPRHHATPDRSALARVLDADGNSEISLAEIRDSVASLRLLDTNADGTLSFAELHPGLAGESIASASVGSPSQPIDPLMAALDLDGDGELSPYEILAAKGRLLTLDANHDGKLARQETRPLASASSE